MPRKVKTSPLMIMDSFIEAYKVKHDKDYPVNYSMIQAAKSLGYYYTLGQVKKAIEYYFSTFGRNQFIDFASKIDKCVEGYEVAKKSKKELGNLIEETKKRIKEYE